MRDHNDERTLYVDLENAQRGDNEFTYFDRAGNEIYERIIDDRNGSYRTAQKTCRDCEGTGCIECSWKGRVYLLDLKGGTNGNSSKDNQILTDSGY